MVPWSSSPLAAPLLLRDGEDMPNTRGNAEGGAGAGNSNYTRDYRERIFTHNRGQFVKLPKMGKRFEELLETGFSLFFSQKTWMRKYVIWGTLGDAQLFGMTK